MGKRGPGASRQRRAAEQVAATNRRLPWKKKGLSKAAQVIAFLQWLPVTKGIRAGKRMRLLPSQREFVEEVFATDRHSRFMRKLAILSQAKGNGKSGLVAGICLAALLGPLAEERGAVYSASITKNKASVIFEEMKAVILRVPEFAARVNIIDFNKKIEVLEGDGFDSTYEALSADHSGAQGLAPTLWAYDELGEAPDGKLLSVLLESDGKRAHTFGIILSTQAESDDHPFSKLIDDAETNADPATYLQIHRAPIDADPFADETIKAANPAYGHFLDLKAIQKSRDRARRIPAYEAGYRRLRLNQRVDASTENRLATAPVWKEGNVPIDPKTLRGRKCVAGLDLASKDDLCALVLAFPTDDDPAKFQILPFFWTPEDYLPKRQVAEQERFREWISAGYLTTVPGATVPFRHIVRELARIIDQYQVETIAYDKWRIDDFKAEMAEAGIDLPMTAFGQGQSKPMLNAIEFFSECALTGRLQHGGHPVLTASVVNAVVTPDKAGNLMIDKPKSNRRGPVRVDGAVALVMALGTARTWEPPTPKRPISDFLKSRPPI